MPTIIIILVIILFVYFLSKSNKSSLTTKTNNRKPPRTEEDIKKELVNNILKNIKIEVTTSPTISKYKDNSVVDITGQALQLNNGNNLIKYEYGVPYWAHQYIYYYSALESATQEQKVFYIVYKTRFMNNIYLDLEGNTNYAFILLFDLINDFNKHRNLIHLEKELFTLGLFYPKTKPYGVSLLITKMQENGDMEGVARLRCSFRSKLTSYSAEN